MEHRSGMELDVWLTRIGQKAAIDDMKYEGIKTLQRLLAMSEDALRRLNKVDEVAMNAIVAMREATLYALKFVSNRGLDNLSEVELKPYHTGTWQPETLRPYFESYQDQVVEAVAGS